MPRVKRGVLHVKTRKSLLKRAKGYRLGRRKTIRLARPAVLKAGRYAYVDRRNKKRTRRQLWLIKLNAALKPYEISYSKFIAALKVKKIELDRKVLSDMAENNPKLFAKIVEKVKA